MQPGLDTYKDIIEVAVIPILVLFLTLFLPRRWQVRQKELEIKSDLVAEISKLVMGSITIIDLLDSSGRVEMQEQEMDKTFTNFKVESCVLKSKIHAYYPNETKAENQMHEKWERFSQSIEEYYEMKKIIIKEKSGIDIDKKRDNILIEKSKIVREILRSKITGFRS